MEDRELLDRFVRDHSQGAFCELVERHLPVVYSTARRMVRDSHLAEEVAQMVFTTLAEKAPSIRPPQVLGGWLYNTTRHLAMHAVRSEQRRREREQTALTMQTLNQASDNHGVDEHLEPAMEELDAEDRDALVLRFLANRAFREVGAELGISDEAARKRVSRALERLRALLEKRGVSATTILLATALTASTIAVPAGLCATITTSALAPAALTTSGATVVKWFTAKAAISMIAGVVVLGTSTALVLRSPNSETAQNGKLQTANSQKAAGHSPASLVSGILKTPEGQPLSGAEVFLSTPFAPVAIYSDRSEKVQATTTGADGRFAFPDDPANRAVIVVHEKGYGEATVADLAKRSELILQPWARIEGTLRQAKKSLANQTIHLSRKRFGSKLQQKSFCTVHDMITTTDADGRYVFDRVAPGDTWISWRTDKGNYDVQFRYLDVRAGQTITADIGGRGRPVTGRAVLADGDEKTKFFGSVWPRTPHRMRRPPNWSELTPDEKDALTADWEKTDDAKLFNQEQCPIDFRLAANGSFAISDLPAGDYRVVVASWTGAPVTSQMTSRGEAQITVPEMPTGRSDEPLEIGTVEAYSAGPLRPGDLAPLFETSTFAGKPLKLADYKGKYVLLNFWRTDRPESMEQMDDLKTAQVAWGQDQRFILIGLNFDANLAEAEKYVSDRKLNWTHCFPGMASNIAARYRLRRPTNVLIGPNGRIIHPDLEGPEIAGAIKEALGGK